jgi:hypothetical protein
MNFFDFFSHGQFRGLDLAAQEMIHCFHSTIQEAVLLRDARLHQHLRLCADSIRGIRVVHSRKRNELQHNSSQIEISALDIDVRYCDIPILHLV